ncbi:hypothetical protein H0A65_11025 [Alcaligenaceae bacterium]|nr:hypothetical protein [Alcaligenaceae bacterium]
MSTNHTFLSDVLAQLRSHKHGELQAIADGANVPEGTVRKLYYGEVQNPRVNTVEALHNYFASKPNPQEVNHA